MKYEKTDNPNVIKRVQTIESEIYLDKLEAEVEHLQIQIKDIPKMKTEPDQECLDHYNMEIEMMGDHGMFEAELKNKQDLLKILRKL